MKLKKSSKNLRKSSPDPPKIGPKRLLNDVEQQDRIQNRSWAAPPEFLELFWQILERLGTQMGSTIDVNFERPILHRQNVMIFEGRGVEVGKASWHRFFDDFDWF